MIILYDVLIAGLILLDYIVYGKKIKPFAIIAGLYTILINFNNLIAANAFGFLLVDGITMMRLLGIFASIFLVEIIFSFIEQKFKKPKMTTHDTCNLTDTKVSIDIDFSKYMFYMNLIFGLCLFAYFVSMLTNMKIYGTNIKGRNSGIVGHLTYFAFLL